MNQQMSIIIPVYNGEKYIIQCIESLLKQSLKKCEFIFINDGSNDKSSQIIEEYKKSDTRIRLINQKNQGVSSARNTGLAFATGEYIGFIDIDDCIEKDMFETLYKSATESNCDIVISNFECEMEGHKVIVKYPFPVDIILNKGYIEEEIFRYFLKNDNLNSVWNKIYKNSIIRENNIKFPEKVALGEDRFFNIEFFGNANSLKYVDYTGYHYKEVAGSATRNISDKDYFDRALEIYISELPEGYLRKINKKTVKQLKSIKLINCVMSYIYLYFSPSKHVSLSKRYKYVRNMICHRDVRNALTICYSEIYSTLGRYDKFIIDMIKRKCTWGLFCATAYSRFRSR